MEVTQGHDLTAYQQRQTDTDNSDLFLDLYQRMSSPTTASTSAPTRTPEPTAAMAGPTARPWST